MYIYKNFHFSISW